jgi:hypothetical protein
MAPEDVERASVRIPLSPAARLAISRELALAPDLPLAPTLRALAGAGGWVEQETLLASRGR